jgi:hypothetical protein
VSDGRAEGGIGGRGAGGGVRGLFPRPGLLPGPGLVSRVRDVRATAGARMPRASAFSRALAARHERRIVDRRPLAMALLRQAAGPGASGGGATHLHSLTIAPRLRLTLAAPQRVAAAASAELPPAAPVQPPLRTVVAVRAEKLTERVMSRGVRIDPRPAGLDAAARRARAAHPAAPPATAAAPVAAADLAVPVRTTVVASPPAAADPARAPGSPQPPAAAPFPLVTHPTAGGTAPRHAPPIDVARVTDAVIASIDRRIVAESERLGRV